MMAVDSIRIGSVQPPEFVDLGRDDVLERTYEAGMKDNLAEPMSSKVAGNRLLAFDEACRAVRSGKRRRKVQVEAGVDRSFPRDRCRALRILHEDHGAHGGDRAFVLALERPIGRDLIASPIVGVHDQAPRGHRGLELINHDAA